jgi:hypothetical protein
MHEVYTQAALPYQGMNNRRVWVEVSNGMECFLHAAQLLIFLLKFPFVCDSFMSTVLLAHPTHHSLLQVIDYPVQTLAHILCTPLCRAVGKPTRSPDQGSRAWLKKWQKWQMTTAKDVSRRVRCIVLT